MNNKRLGANMLLLLAASDALHTGHVGATVTNPQTGHREVSSMHRAGFSMASVSTNCCNSSRLILTGIVRGLCLCASTAPCILQPYLSLSALAAVAMIIGTTASKLKRFFCPKELSVIPPK